MYGSVRTLHYCNSGQTPRNLTIKFANWIHQHFPGDMRMGLVLFLRYCLKDDWMLIFCFIMPLRGDLKYSQ